MNVLELIHELMQVEDRSRQIWVHYTMHADSAQPTHVALQDLRVEPWNEIPTSIVKLVAK